MVQCLHIDDTEFELHSIDLGYNKILATIDKKLYN